MNHLRLTFVVASNDRGILDKNLLASPCMNEGGHQIIIQQDYASAALAYNKGLVQSANEIVVFVHQDVFLPEHWIAELTSALQSLENTDPQWGVLGVCGITRDRVRLGHLYTPGEGVIGSPLPAPKIVRTLDEVLLVLRKSSGLKFDEQLPGFHFYGSDICLEAAERGLSCYAFSAFCIHNSRQYFEYPDDFYICYRQLKHKWADCLPIQTSCICISRFDWDLKKRRVKKAMAAASGRSLERGARIDDPRIILSQIQTSSSQPPLTFDVS